MNGSEEFPMRRSTKTVRFAENLEFSSEVMNYSPSRTTGQAHQQTKSALRLSAQSISSEDFGALSISDQSDPFEDFSEAFDVPDESSALFTIYDVLNGPSGMYSNPDRKNLLDVSKFYPTIAGYAYEDYRLNGRKFEANVEKPKSDVADILMEFHEIWLEIQFFWDLLLRIQPNYIIADAEHTKEAVDFLLDLSIASLLPLIRPDYQVSAARMQIKCFRRRLRRLELLLRNEMNACGHSTAILCGCLVDIKRPKHKFDLWGPIFENRTSSQPTPSENNAYRIRDIAGLLKLEDYMGHFFKEFEHQFGYRKKSGAEIVMAAIDFMDDEIKQFLPKEYRHRYDVRPEWVNVLLHPEFRAAVAREVNSIATEALAYHIKHGSSAHRKECLNNDLLI
ncbi:hypothetical protein FLAG1_03426 [Fusarium langsethiae]|uniref:Uncharacterized protein n=1 Tax=Fusarium langsethiae TaxID=179993 RepID=A0A0M9F0U9_FUSLA|nr:hypothetical protein FLAG1_03426 [Fusarium langsethiae]GKU01223.1 unnamed protein product [Fusarium langsethiae]GKU11027.1 unnamed protein product [Fusarium langsethiae]